MSSQYRDVTHIDIAHDENDEKMIGQHREIIHADVKHDDDDEDG